MKQNSIIKWMDAVKLAIGIMVGLTSTLLIIISVSKTESEDEPVIDEEVREVYHNKIVIDKDSIIDLNEVYIPTVEDILNEREECKYMRYIDSIYMAMPQEILTHILIQKGTSLLMTEIVEEYLDHKEMYHEILKKADVEEFICAHYSRSCFQIRNKWMVDKSSRVIAVWNGEPSGTKNTIDYAKKCNLEVRNLFGT